MIEKIKKGASNLLRNKLRTLLTVSGIVIGVLSVVIISTIGEIGTETIDDQLVKMGMDSVVITGDKNDKTGLNERDLSVIKEVQEVTEAMPLLYFLGDTEILETSYDCMLWGVDQNADKVIELNVIHGRLINQGDVNSYSRVCLIDEQVALKSYKRSNIVGKKIIVNANGTSEEYEVIGVVQNGVNMLQNMLGEFIPDFVYIPYTTMKESYSQDYFDQIAVKIMNNDNEDIDDTLSRAILQNRYYDTELSIENLLKQKEQLTDIMNIITLILSVIAGISLVVSGLSIMTVMLVSVNERTREIGIKKSIGATNKDIMSEFLVESVLITSFGGLIGSCLGIGFSLVGCLIFNVTPIINIAMILKIVIVAVVIGLVFGVYPSYRASKLKPVEALRFE